MPGRQYLHSYDFLFLLLFTLTFDAIRTEHRWSATHGAWRHASCALDKVCFFHQDMIMPLSMIFSSIAYDASR